MDSTRDSPKQWYWQRRAAMVKVKVIWGLAKALKFPVITGPEQQVVAVIEKCARDLLDRWEMENYWSEMNFKCEKEN